MNKDDIKKIKEGSKIKRKSGDTVEVLEVMRSTNGNIAALIPNYWDDGTTIVDKGGLKKHFTEMIHG